jgi:DNA-binding IclR family transcriptional regulator
LVTRTLELFELFAAERRPLPLTELARGLDAPVSSCLALARTLVGRGYLTQGRGRSGYYPTPRLLELGQAIDAPHPVVALLRPHLAALRDASGETAVLGQIRDNKVEYLEVAESFKAVRYNVKPGERRPVHANSIGKAIFAALPPAAQQGLAKQLGLSEPELAALSADIEVGGRRGWYFNRNLSMPELSAVAVAFTMQGGIYGVSVAGPTERIVKQQAAHGVLLSQLKTDLMTGAPLE